MNNSIEPCKGLENILQRAADGSLKGFMKVFALFHAGRCKGCGTYLERMELTIKALREGREHSENEEALARLKAKVQELAKSSD
ncbi:MAG: hypothetical protein K8R88_08050 [Armatimonadetes bacterium]|nr:hypothetical protein [Armatimonadota bacterium]